MRERVRRRTSVAIVFGLVWTTAAFAARGGDERDWTGSSGEGVNTTAARADKTRRSASRPQAR
jgi:hypothetical protein